LEGPRCSYYCEKCKRRHRRNSRIGKDHAHFMVLFVECPLHGKEVPHWYCTGSFMRGKNPCPELISIELHFSKCRVRVRCRRREDR